MKKHKKQNLKDPSTKASTKSKRKKMLGGEYLAPDSLDEVEIGMAFYDNKMDRKDIYKEFSSFDPKEIDEIIAKGPSP